MADEYTNTERALILLAQTFYTYAEKNKGGSDNELERDEMDMLLKEELKNLKEDDRSFEKFDRDNSGTVTFAEFMREMAVVGEKLQGKVKNAVQQCK